jgi:hypothetical protein
MTEGKYWDDATATPKNRIGTTLRTKDGRTFVYAKAAGTIAKGLFAVAAPDVVTIPATYFGVDTSTAPAVDEGGAIDDTKIRMCVVTGTKTLTADEYADGFLIITAGTGAGMIVPLTSNDANAASGSSLLYTAYGLPVALDNTSAGTIMKNPWRDVVIGTAGDQGADPDEIVVGATMAAMSTDTPYAWVQTWGVACLLASAAHVKQGANVILSENTNGNAQLPVAGENIIQYVGWGLTDFSSTAYGPVYLRIRP